MEAFSAGSCPRGNIWCVDNEKIDIVWITNDPAQKALLKAIWVKTYEKCYNQRCPSKTIGFSCIDAYGCSSSMCENSGDCGRFILAEDDELDDSSWETDIHLSVWSYGNVCMTFWFLDRNT